MRRPLRLIVLTTVFGIAVSAARSRAQTAATSAAVNRDGPFAGLSLSAQALRDSIVQMAKSQLGARYKRGGQTPARGFDCSGLVKYVMSVFNFDVPRTAHQQAAVGTTIARDTVHLLPGDLL